MLKRCHPRERLAPGTNLFPIKRKLLEPLMETVAMISSADLMVGKKPVMDVRGATFPHLVFGRISVRLL